MPTEPTPRSDHRHFRTVLIIGGVAFAIALGFVLWVKTLHQAGAEPSHAALAERVVASGLHAPVRP